MRKAVILILSAALGLGAALAVASCGGDDEIEGKIPQAAAQDLLSRLQEVRDNIDVGSCLVAQDRAETLVEEIEQLPDSVDEELRRALRNGGQNLAVRLNDPAECDQQEPEETTPTETEVTEPLPTETEPTETQPTTPTTPPNGGGGGGGGGTSPPTGGTSP